jgi:hypothetical protein
VMKHPLLVQMKPYWWFLILLLDKMILRTEEVMERLQNRYRELGRRQLQSFFNSRRDALTEELYFGEIRFNADWEIY